MIIAIIGSGGREHAICKKISESPKVNKIYCIPGNAGTNEKAENIEIDIDNFDQIKDLSRNIFLPKTRDKKLEFTYNELERTRSCRIVLTISEHANTSAASIPLALDAAISDGRIQKGHLLLMEAMGGGLTWGAALVRW